MPRVGVALAKLVARSGVSRRVADTLVRDARVTLNGEVCRTGQTRVISDDTVAVDGVRVEISSEQPRVWRFHKPVGLITTHDDPQGRPTVFSALPPDMPRVISVGRLDVRSQGLLLLTTSGKLAGRLEHPSSAFLRSYDVQIALGRRSVTDEMLAAMESGLTLADGFRFRPMQVERMPAVRDFSAAEGHRGSPGWFEVHLREGKKHEVRRAWRHFGFDVSRLIRVGYGPFILGGLPPGECEEVPPPRVRALMKEPGDGRASREAVSGPSV
jgi:23S rRNA pseudouridine2605 synthase